MSSSQEKKCMYSSERELDLPQWSFHNIYKYQIILLYNGNNYVIHVS